MVTSKVAPPHISRLNRFGQAMRDEVGDAPACRSVRMRVASSDWCASRNVVSVISRRFCDVVHSANFAGPSSSSSCRVPRGGVAAIVRRHRARRGTSRAAACPPLRDCR